jgi:molybdopterin-guanine dinucleotide biosynthesis protein A
VSPGQVTLGILAGGRATRLGGIDKAWLEREGVPQVLRLARRFASQVDAVLVSANRDLARYEAHGLATVTDRIPVAGPIGGIEALAQACGTPWLLTLPVDLVGVNECLLQSLFAAAADRGASAVDEAGAQPLVALWNVVSLHEAVAAAIADQDFAIHRLQQRVGMSTVRFPGVRFGNLNTPADLVAAGMAP